MTELVFECPGCGRTVPESFGAADNMPELCDDCWYHVTKWREKAMQELREGLNGRRDFK